MVRTTLPQTPILISAREFGRQIGLGSRTIRNMALEGRIKSVKLNSRVLRIPVSELARIAGTALI